ncbi:MAG: tandem-95 repeat protein, partial [Pseudomonadota bacterium]
DTDIDGDTLTLSGLAQPNHGILIDNLDGTLTYLADANYAGPDQFSYTVSDGRGGTHTAVATLSIAAVNDAPTLTSPTQLSQVEGSTATATLTGSDVEDDALSYRITGGADAGAFNLDAASGALSLSSAADYEAPTDADSDNRFEIEVTVTDSQGAETRYPLTVAITDRNEAPVADDLTINMDWQPDALVAGQLTVADQDGGEQLTFRILAGNDDGFFSVDPATGAVNTTPDAAAGSYELMVEVTDSGGLTSTAAVTLNIDPIPEATPPPLELDGSQPGADPVPEGPAAPTPSGPAPQVLKNSDIARGVQTGPDPGTEHRTSEPEADQPSEAQAPSEPIDAEVPVVDTSGFDNDRSELLMGERWLSLSESDEMNDARAINETSVGRLLRLLFESRSNFEGLSIADAEDGLALDIALPAALAQALEELQQGFDADDEALTLQVAGAVTGAISLSAGFVAWLMRAGSLLAGLMATRPAWSEFDVLPIFDADAEDALGENPSSGDER